MVRVFMRRDLTGEVQVLTSPFVPLTKAAVSQE
jgi:hypothetical protein